MDCKYSQARRTQEGIFDCSSLVARAYSVLGKAWKYGGKGLRSLHLVYDDDFELLWPKSYAVIGKKQGGSFVIAKVKQPGDLQFLNTMSTGRANKITHVTMVASASKIVHARGTAYGVRTDNAAGVFRTATAFFFIANEGLSTVENVGEMSDKLPGFITGALTKLRDERDFDHTGEGE